MRTEEQILAEINQAQKEYERVESALTHIIRGQIDPIQEVDDDSTNEMLTAQGRPEDARQRLENLHDEYEFYQSNQSGSRKH